MKKLATGVLAGTLIYGPGLLLAQQQSPTDTSPHSQDVPHQAPGSNNPDLQPQRKPVPNKGAQPSPGAGKSTQNNPDVPHQEPGTDNPDVGKQRQPETGTSTSTRSTSSKKKSKRRKQSSVASETQTSSQS